MQRILGMVAASVVLLASVARADQIVFNYQKSQWTGYTSGGNKINTFGGHVGSKDFTDGSKDSRRYRITLLPFGQTGTPNPVYENKPANATVDFMKQLEKQYGDKFAFTYVGFKGENEFNIQSYSVKADNGGLVGADLYAIYNPGKDDPAIGDDLHWIQTLWTNWKSADGKSEPGVVQHLVEGPADNPFYDSDGTAGQVEIDGKNIFNFYDSPVRNSQFLAGYKGKFPLEWMAEDFLAFNTKKQNADKKTEIVIYGGIQYGWRITVVAEPASIVLIALGFGLLLAYGRVRRTIFC
jgi:hypothetical protein